MLETSCWILVAEFGMPEPGSSHPVSSIQYLFFIGMDKKILPRNIGGGSTYFFKKLISY
jgi:hypothetical protein